MPLKRDGNDYYLTAERFSFVSQGKPGAPGKRRPTQRRGSKPEPKPDQRNGLRPKTRTSARLKLKNVPRPRQAPSLLKRREGQQKVGTSFLFKYTLFTQCPHFALCSLMLRIHGAVLWLIVGWLIECLVEWLNDGFLCSGPGPCPGDGLKETRRRNPSAGPWEPKTTLPPPATSWDSYAHIWMMVRVWVGSYTVHQVSQVSDWALKSIIFQVTFTWTPTKAVPMMLWRYSVTSQQEEQPALTLYSHRYAHIHLQGLKSACVSL